MEYITMEDIPISGIYNNGRSGRYKQQKKWKTY